MHWYLEFERWYIGVFSIVFAAWMYVRGNRLSAVRRHFKFEVRDGRLKDRFTRAISRREELEGDTSIAWRITAVFSAIFGALVLLRVLSPVVGYALLCASLAIVLSQIYANMRNRGERRAAALTPRTATSAVPGLWYAGAVASAVLPLALLTDPRFGVAAAIVAIACTIIVVVAARASGMAALLAGDDPEVELYIDERLRWMRLTGLLALCYAASFVFIAIATPSPRESSLLMLIVQVVSWLLILGFGVSAFVIYFRGRKRASRLA